MSKGDPIGKESIGKVKDTSRCEKMVSNSDVFMRSHQCTRKAGHGPDGTFCQQHALAYTSTEPIAVWYRTRNRYGFEIEAVEVFAITEKTLLIRSEFASKDIKERIKLVTEYYHFWPTWEEAVESLRKRLESQRESLAQSEKDFERAASNPPHPKKFKAPPENLRL